MRSQLRPWRCAIVVLAVAAVLAVASGTAGATQICIKKTCVNVPPVAVTNDGTLPTGFGAMLNGSAGPGVQTGDVTQYSFDYGTTTSYGSSTKAGTIGACPAGVTNPVYCSVPPSEYVNMPVTGLTPCTTYHFRVVATSSDGTTDGLDRTFNSGFGDPVVYIHHHLHDQSAHRHGFTISLRTPASIKVFLLLHGKRKRIANLGLRSGTFRTTIRITKPTGTYTLKWVARLSCGSQTITKTVTVFSKK